MTSVTATAARSRWPKDPSGEAARQQREDITPAAVVPSNAMGMAGEMAG
jgi:hypothetical protein